MTGKVKGKGKVEGMKWREERKVEACHPSIPAYAPATAAKKID